MTADPTVQGINTIKLKHKTQFCILLQSLFCPTCTYSEEPKSVTAFDLFTFFHADLIQSEAWKLSSTFDWLMSA